MWSKRLKHLLVISSLTVSLFTFSLSAFADACDTANNINNNSTLNFFANNPVTTWLTNSVGGQTFQQIGASCQNTSALVQMEQWVRATANANIPNSLSNILSTSGQVLGPNGLPVGGGGTITPGVIFTLPDGTRVNAQGQEVNADNAPIPTRGWILSEFQQYLAANPAAKAAADAANNPSSNAAAATSSNNNSSNVVNTATNSVSSSTTTTTYVSPSFAGSSSTPASSTTATNSLGADTVLVNIAGQMPAVLRLLYALSYVIGFYLIFWGILKLKQYGEARTQMSSQHHLKEPIMFIFVGALLIYFPSTVSVGMNTFWGQAVPFGYNNTSNPTLAQIYNSALAVLEVFGTIAFIRGLVLLTRLGGGHGQPGTLAKALTHIIGGLFLINMSQFIKIVFLTIGIQPNW